MKKFLLSLVLGTSLALVSTPASAAGVIFYSNGEQLEIFQKLPADYEFDDGDHMNIGVMYNQFSIMWIPVWNYGETKWVWVNDAKDAYNDEVSEEELEYFRTEYAYDIPEKPRIGFWNSIGGKLVWAAIIGGIFLLDRKKKAGKEEEEQEVENGEPATEESEEEQL